MNKYFWIAVVVVTVGMIYLATTGGFKIDSLRFNTSPSLSPSISPTPSPIVKKQKSVPTPVPKTYTELVKEYVDRRIQFDQNCQMSPNSVTYKNGVSMMLDNRSAETKKITVGGTNYSIGGYGYKIITLSSKNLPNELWFNCNSATNIGRVLLQAKILP